jgi:hypothetical protein
MAMRKGDMLPLVPCAHVVQAKSWQIACRLRSWLMGSISTSSSSDNNNRPTVVVDCLSGLTDGMEGGPNGMAEMCLVVIL